MKTFLVAVVFVLLLGLGGLREARAQYYPGYSPVYRQGVIPPQAVDAYYQLHVMHYQLYLPSHGWYPTYPFYPAYGACCANNPYPWAGYPSSVAPAPPAVIFAPQTVILSR